MTDQAHEYLKKPLSPYLTPICKLYFKFKNKYNILSKIYLASSGKSRAFTMSIKPLLKSLKIIKV